jgi:hypothetical protein
MLPNYPVPALSTLLQLEEVLLLGRFATLSGRHRIVLSRIDNSVHEPIRRLLEEPWLKYHHYIFL